MAKKIGCHVGSQKIQGICVKVPKNWHGETKLSFFKYKGEKDYWRKQPEVNRPHVADIENENLSLSGLEHKLYALDEDHEDKWVINLTKKDILKRRKSSGRRRID